MSADAPAIGASQQEGAGGARLRAPDAGASETAPLSPAAALIRLDNIWYAHEGETEPVLRGVSLTVGRGEFVLIMGPSGCGKSTLLHVLNGAIPHLLKGRLEGEAFVCGQDVATTKVSAFATEVGMVFQDPEGQIINTRVRDEVCFGLENLCRPADEIMTRQAEALAFVGLPDAGERSIFDLSGGQKQRVSIAAVLAARPQLLVLDEPTANLDPAGMAEIFAVLDRLNRESGATIVMVEHRVDELADKVSRVVMMNEGAVVFDGDPRSAFAMRRGANSPEDAGAAAATSAWLPQVSEFMLDLADAAGFAPSASEAPLCVADAVAFGERVCAGGRLRASAAAPASAQKPPEREGPPLLEVRDLDYGYERRKPILQGVSLALQSATIVALMGRNGSGKTTLARTLMGINPPPKGTVLFNGKDASTLGAREIAAEVGYVFQNPDHQFVTDRVDDEIAYGLKVRDYSAEAIEQRVNEVLGVVDLVRYRDRSPFSLSLGERRRLSVATMLALEPKLLVLDEPTIGQDYERAQQLMGLMAKLRERYGTATLMITHDVRLVADWADRALVLSEGRLAFDGEPEALFAQEPLLEECGLLAPPIFEVSRALSRAHPDWGLAPTASVQRLVNSLALAAGAR